MECMSSVTASTSNLSNRLERLTNAASLTIQAHKVNYLQALLESHECLVPGDDAGTKNTERRSR
jgi:hypothetical protein